MGGYNDAILKALEFVGNLKQNRQQQTLEQQRIQNEQTFRERQLALQEKAADRLYELQHAQLDAEQAQRALGNAVSYQQTGINPPNTQVLPGIQPTPSQPLVLSGLENAQLTGPGGTTITVPPLSQSPSVLLAQQTAKAAEAAKIREQLAQQQAETTRQTQIEQIRGAEETKRDIARTVTAAQERLTLQQMIIDANKHKDDQDNATKLREGMINATGGMSELYPNMFGGQGPNAANTSIVKLNPDGSATVNSSNLPTNINNSLNNIYNGRDSLERIEKTNPKLKQMIATTAGMNNIGSLTDEETKGLHDLQLEIPALQTLQELHQIKIDSPLLGVNVPFFNSTFNTKEKELGTNVGHIAISQTGAKRQNEADLQRFHAGLMPSRDLMQRSTTEQDKLNDYIEKLKSDARSYVQGLPPDQQNVVLHNYGMLDLDKYKVGKQATQQTQPVPQAPKQPIINIPQILQNSGNKPSPLVGPTQPTRGLPNIGVPYVPPTGLPVLPPSKMWVKRKSDGQTVNIPKDEWDSRKYESVQ